jgi:hypothetical protein
MKHKRIIIAASGGVLLLALFVLFAPRGNGDVSKVRIGFAGYGVVDGKRSLILIVTNGSSYRISQPDGRCELRGESPDSMMMSSRGMHTISCGFGAAEWGWWQLRPPKIPSVAPGATFRFTIPVDEQPYTWHVTVPLTTVPFRDRLPFALRSRWPSSKRDAPISFEVSPPPIPPAPSQVLSAASVIESGRTP